MIKSKIITSDLQLIKKVSIMIPGEGQPAKYVFETEPLSLVLVLLLLETDLVVDCDVGLSEIVEDHVLGSLRMSGFLLVAICFFVEQSYQIQSHYFLLRELVAVGVGPIRKSIILPFLKCTEFSGGRWDIQRDGFFDFPPGYKLSRRDVCAGLFLNLHHEFPNIIDPRNSLTLTLRVGLQQFINQAEHLFFGERIQFPIVDLFKALDLLVQLHEEDKLICLGFELDDVSPESFYLFDFDILLGFDQ